MVQCGSKSESGKNMEEDRGGEFALTPYSTPFSCCFFLLASLCAVPTIWMPGTATFSEGLVRQGILLPGKWTWYFHCDIVALQMCIRLSCFRFWQRVSNGTLALKISPDVLIYLLSFTCVKMRVLVHFSANSWSCLLYLCFGKITDLG